MQTRPTRTVEVAHRTAAAPQLLAEIEPAENNRSGGGPARVAP